MNKIIGLTGNIGSGKTSVSHFFELLNWPVFNSDIAAKTILLNNPAVKTQLIDHFGPKVMNSNGEINTVYLGEIALDATNSIYLNKLIHPLVGELFNKWLAQQNSPFIIRETALLFEAKIQHESYKNILVTCPFEERLKRALKRGGISEKSIRAREQLQLPESSKIPLCDFIVDNFKTPLIPQLVKIQQKLEEH